MAEREKVQASVHWTATSITVELSRVGKVKRLLERFGSTAAASLQDTILMIARNYAKRAPSTHAEGGQVEALLARYSL